MAPTDSLELEGEQKEKTLHNGVAEGTETQLGGKCEFNSQEEMVTSFIEDSPTSETGKSLFRVIEEKKVDSTEIAIDEMNITDPGEGTSGQEKYKSVVIKLPEEQRKSETPASNNNEEELVTNGTCAVTTTAESPVQVVDDNTPEEKQETATIKNTKRYEIQRWDNRRSCFFVFFLLLFIIWAIAYYLYASGWINRKINNIR